MVCIDIAIETKGLLVEAPLMAILLNLCGNIDQLTFRKPDIHLGKHPDNDICTSGHSVRVSRNHAVLSWDGKRGMIRDLNSLHGTYANGHRVGSDAASDVKSGDRVRVADIELEVHY
jgi:pSer/pThr/pTyr-binding forkhead associated (FHA) protein